MVPGTGDGEGNNKEENDDEPEGFDFLRPSARFFVRVTQFFSAIQRLGHGFIVAEGRKCQGCRCGLT